jgi:hypothetical protein
LSVLVESLTLRLSRAASSRIPDATVRPFVVSSIRFLPLASLSWCCRPTVPPTKLHCVSLSCSSTLRWIAPQVSPPRVASVFLHLDRRSRGYPVFSSSIRLPLLPQLLI